MLYEGSDKNDDFGKVVSISGRFSRIFVYWLISRVYISEEATCSRLVLLAKM